MQRSVAPSDVAEGYDTDHAMRSGPPRMCCILVVDGEPWLRKVIRASLAAGGCTVEKAGTGTDAMGLLQRRSSDLVVLDINRSGLNGLEACRKIRSIAPQSGIVMATVRDSEEDMVRALEAGADDYVAKPFRFRELVACIGTVLRRTRRHGLGEPTHVEAGDLRMDFRRRHLWKGFDLLSFPMKNQSAPMTHAKPLAAVWGAEYAGESEYLRSYAWMLRKKIEDDPAQPFYLVTEPRVGYRFNNPVDSGSPPAPFVADDLPPE